MSRCGDSSMRLNKGPRFNVSWALQDQLLKYAIIGNVISVVRKGMDGSISIYLLSAKWKIQSQFDERLQWINRLGSKENDPNFADICQFLFVDETFCTLNKISLKRVLYKKLVRDYRES